MDHKEIGYINGLSVPSFWASHLDILENAKKISNPHVAKMVESYECFINELGQHVKQPQKTMLELNEGKVAAYNACRKAVEALVSSGKIGETVSTLSHAFGKSIYRLSSRNLCNALDASECIASQISKDELDAYNLREQVERFISVNKAYNESRGAVAYNRSVCKNEEILRLREVCSTMYRCIHDLANVFARQGDEKCQEFVSWLKGK